MKDITVMDQCTVRTERIVEEQDLIAVGNKVANLAKDNSQLHQNVSELVALFKENTEAIGKIQDELQEMPGGYRNSQDIKHLKGRIERLEAKDPSVYDDRIAKLAARVSDIEVYVQGIRANKFATVKEMREADDYLAKQAIKMEECCKNTVSAGKELEKRVCYTESAIKNHEARLNNQRELIDGFRTNVQQVVRDFLKSL